jgi:hypothetical protein
MCCAVCGSGQDFQNAQTKYKTFIKNKVQRQIQIVKPGATPGTAVTPPLRALLLVQHTRL